MKKLIVLVGSLMLIGCSDSNTYVVNDCLVEKLEDSQQLTCGGASVNIPDQMPVLEIIDPCGDGPGQDEVVIKLEDGLFLAWYQGLGLSVLQSDLPYVTTDAQRCRFKITNNELLEL